MDSNNKLALKIGLDFASNSHRSFLSGCTMYMAFERPRLLTVSDNKQNKQNNYLSFFYIKMF